MVAYHPYSLPVLAWVQFSESGLNSTVPLVVLMLAVGAAGIALSHLLARRQWFARNSSFRSAVDLSSSRDSSGPQPDDLRWDGINFASVTRRQTAAPITADIVHKFGDFQLVAHFQTRSRRVVVLMTSGATNNHLLKLIPVLIQPTVGPLLSSYI